MVSDGSDKVIFILGSVCTKIGSGATPRGGNQVYSSDGPYALIRSQNVYNDGFHFEGLAFIDELHAQELKNVEVKRDDILLNITGDSVARCCQVDPLILPARVNQHVAIIRSDSTKLDPKFLKYFLICPESQAKLLSLARSGATRPALTKAMIESITVQAPKDVFEQRAIASILGALDDKIELNRQMNHTLEQMAQALFQSWFVDFDPVWAKKEGRQPFGMDADTAALFPDDFEESELGLIPVGWRTATLPEIIEINPSRTLSRGSEVPFLDMANMPIASPRAMKVIRRTFQGSGTKFMNGDVLVARITPSLENGKTAFVDFLQDEEVGWGSTEYIVLKAGPNMVPEYVYYLARDESFRTFAIQNMTGTSGRQRVPTSCFDQYAIVVPNLEVMKVFGELTHNFLRAMKAHDEESQTLITIRDTLLPKLLSGELRVPITAEDVLTQEVTSHDA